MKWKGIESVVLEQAGVELREGLVRIPYRRPDGSEHNAKLVAAGGRSWWRRSGLPLIPFGLETIPADEAEAVRYGFPVIADVAMIVCEGESDTLAVRQAFNGLPYKVLGLPGAHTWKSEWREHLEAYTVVYLVGDGDEAGRRMINTILADAVHARPVLLDKGDDARALLQREGDRALDPLLDAADFRHRLWHGLQVARSIDELETILRGQEVRNAV